MAFKCDSALNTIALAKAFDTITGVHFAEYTGSLLNVNNIQDSIYSTHIALIFSHGWGDCWAGCLYRRYWKFNVFPDCSVEFVGSYGSPLSIATNEYTAQPFFIFPNPVLAFLQVNIPEQEKITSLKITDVFGRTVPAIAKENGQIDCSHLPNGLYFLTLTTSKGTQVLRFSKVD